MTIDEYEDKVHRTDGRNVKIHDTVGCPLVRLLRDSAPWVTHCLRLDYIALWYRIMSVVTSFALVASVLEWTSTDVAIIVVNTLSAVLTRSWRTVVKIYTQPNTTRTQHHQLDQFYNPFNASCSKLLLFDVSAPYWSNPPFLIFDIRTLWRSVLSARASEC